MGQLVSFTYTTRALCGPYTINTNDNNIDTILFMKLVGHEQNNTIVQYPTYLPCGHCTKMMKPGVALAVAFAFDEQPRKKEEMVIIP